MIWVWKNLLHLSALHSLNDSYKVYFLGHDDDEIIGAKKFGFLTIGLKNKNADIYISKIEELSNIL